MSESIYELIGGNGNYQHFILVLVYIAQINIGLNLLLPVFINNFQEFSCSTQQNRSTEIFYQYRIQFHRINNITESLILNSRRCSYKLVSEICTSVTMIPDQMISNIRSQFSLYCEYSSWSSYAVLALMIGIFIGSLFGGIFSDTCGRIWACFLGYALLSVGSTMAAVSPIYILHVLGRLIVGISSSVCFVANSGMVLEVVELKQRTNYGYYWALGYETGFLLLVLLAFVLRNHLLLQIVICCLSYVSLIFPFFYKESFRWLLAKEKYEKAKITLKYIASFNKKDLPVNKIEECVEKFKAEKSNIVVKRFHLKEVWKYKVVVINLLCLWFLYFSSAFSYYTFVLGSSKISDQIFVAVSISAVAAIVCRIIYMFLCRIFGRITIILSLQIGLVLLFVSSMILNFVLGAKNIVTVLLLMIAIALSGTNFGFMWIYGGEAFPTVIRATTVSIGSGCARIAGMIATQMEWVFDESPYILPVISAILATIGLLCAFFILPETFKRPSLDFLPEAEKYFLKWRRPWLKRTKIGLNTDDNETKGITKLGML